MLPLYPVQQYTDQISFDTIDLNVYFTEGSYTSEWYEDDHDGYGYENGEFRLAKFVCHGSQDKFMMSQTIDGHYNSKIMTYKLNMKGLPFTVNSIEVDGQVVQNLDGDLLITAAFKTCIIK